MELTPIRTAVITAAGFGTRLLPATRAIPKEMLPVFDRPLLQYAVEEAQAAGIEEVIIVVSERGKPLIEEHFRHYSGNDMSSGRTCVEATGKVRKARRPIDIRYVIQRDRLGLGHAVLTAKQEVGDHPFVLLLPDDLVIAEVPICRQLCDVFRKQGGAVLAVEVVSKDRLGGYGVVNPGPTTGNVCQVHGLVEKPRPEEAPSNLGIVGRYALPPAIFGALTETEPGKNGEIQLTDGLNVLLSTSPVFGLRFTGVRYDTGTPLGLLKASIAQGLRHTESKTELLNYLSRLEAGR